MQIRAKTGLCFILCLVFWVRPALGKSETLVLNDKERDKDIIAHLRVVEVPQEKKSAQKKKNKRLPVVMVFGGFENAAKVLDLLHPKSSLILASFDYPATFPRKFSFPESLSLGPQVKEMINQTRSGICELAKKLATRRDVDASRILVLGASFGAPFAIRAAADCPELIRGLVIVHGFGDLKATTKHIIKKSFERRDRESLIKWSGPAAGTIAELAFLVVNPPPPEEAIAELDREQKVLMIAATEDSMVPKDSTNALWLAIEESKLKSKTLQWSEGDHVLPGADALVAQLLKRVETWISQSF